ncbi:UbiA family prenyltransferase [Actinokineospora auranticolor]|uniref:UbiA family prenyltransferase n=1 Tax=Actinokineospora auranticolor TaxID=155976 RepID=UPI0015E2ADF3|nr:UbiA family prenyltransferase [Actinokineospora auranticolor]
MTNLFGFDSPKANTDAATGIAARGISTTRAIRLALREARWTVQLMYLLRFAIGARLADPSGLLLWHTSVGMLAWFAVCVAIYALNGISDVDGDRRNGSRRPIATGALPVPAAWRAVACLSVVGVAAAALVSAALVLLTVLMLMLGWAYSFGPRPLKNSVPGLVFSGTALGALTYLAGAVAVRGPVPGVDMVVFALGLSLWMGVVGTATKDLKDVRGDRLAVRRTLPILLGPERATTLARVLAVGYGAAFLLVSTAFAPGVALPALCVLAGGIMLAAAPWVLQRTRKSPRPDCGKDVYRVYMVTQYVANLALLV